MTTLPPLSSNAESIRTAARLHELEDDLRGHFDALAHTQLAHEAELGREQLAPVLARLLAHDDSAWWIEHRGLFKPLTSERRYEDYPSALWKVLLRDFGRAPTSATASVGSLSVESVSTEVHEALSPEPPTDLVAALRKGGHREFLATSEGFVAVHAKGVRARVGGKAVAKSIPKGQGGITHASASGTDPFVWIGNIPWGLHRFDPAAKGLRSFAVPVGIGERGFAALGDGVALMSPDGELRLCAVGDEDELRVVASARHPELPPNAMLASVVGPPDRLFASALDGAGRGHTLVATWDGHVLRWDGRLDVAIWTPRRDADGSIVAMVDREHAVRIR